MVYGMILLEHIKWKPTEQRVGIQAFARKNGLKIDQFLSYFPNPNILNIKSGDTVVFYDWSCICNSRKYLNVFLEHLINKHVCIYSVQSKYNIDENTNFDQLVNAFNFFEDIRFRFLSNQNTKVVQSRIAQGQPAGRHKGSKNKTHVWDEHEAEILLMHADGFSMYAIAKKMNINAPAVRRCLIANNIKDI